MSTLAVVGSRSFTDYRRMCEVLDAMPRPVRIVSGGANGADKLAERYAAERGIDFDVFCADWEVYGKSAGFRRNSRIVAVSDGLVAFWDGESRGTEHTIRIARAKGIPVHVCTPPTPEHSEALGAVTTEGAKDA